MVPVARSGFRVSVSLPPTTQAGRVERMHPGIDGNASIERIRRHNHLQVLLVGSIVYVADVALSWAGVWGYGGDAPARLAVVLIAAAFIVRLSVRRTVSRPWELAGLVLLTVANWLLAVSMFEI